MNRSARCSKVILGFGLAMLLAACGGGAAPSPATSGSTSAGSPKASGSAASSASAKAPTSAAGSANASAGPSTLAQVVAYKGADRESVMEAGAKNEKQVTWYTTMAGPVLDAIKAGFQKDYPFLTLNIYRADSTELAERAVTEFKAGKHGSDVFGGTYAPLVAGREAGMLVPYYSPYAEQESKDMSPKTPDGLAEWATVVQYSQGFGYNTNLLKTGIPSKDEDLLNAALKGKMAITPNTTGMQWVGYLAATYGNDFVSKLTAQKFSIQQVSGAALLDLMTRGEVIASPVVYREHVTAAKKKGAPVEWVGLSDTAIESPEYATIPKNASNPHAAMLFIDFLLSDKIADIFHQYNYTRPTEDIGVKHLWFPATPQESSSDISAKLTKWQDMLKKF